MEWRLFGFRLGNSSRNNSGKLVEKYWKEPNHIRECLPSEKGYIAIINTGKLSSWYNCCKIHKKGYFKEVGDTGYIIHRTDGLLYLIKE